MRWRWSVGLFTLLMLGLVCVWVFVPPLTLCDLLLGVESRCVGVSAASVITAICMHFGV